MNRHSFNRADGVSLLLLVLGIAMTWAQGLQFVAEDGRVAPMLCCDLSTNVAELVLAERAGTPWSPSPLSWLTPGAMSWAARGTAVLFGLHIDTLLWTQLLALALAQAATYWLVRPMGGRLAALVGVWTLPLVPGIMAATTSWSPYPIQGLCMLVGLGAVLRSHSLSRWRWVVLAAVAAFVATTTSHLITDDLLAMVSIAAVGGAAAYRGLVLARGPFGDRVARWRVVVGIGVGLLVLGLLLRGAAENRVDLHRYAAYYAQELGIATATESAPAYTHLAPVASTEARIAYPRRLWEMEVGPLLSVVAIIGLLTMGRRGRWGATAELRAGIALPLFFLTLIAKKQFFYVYLILPWVPVVIASLWASHARRPPLQTGLAIAIALAWVVVLNGQATDLRTNGPRHSLVARLGALPTKRVGTWQSAVFQWPQPLSLVPQLANTRSTDDTLMESLLSREHTCERPLRVLLVGPNVSPLAGETDTAARLTWRLVTEGRCIRVQSMHNPGQPMPDEVLVWGNANCEVNPTEAAARDWAKLQAQTSWSIAAETRADAHCVRILTRSLPHPEATAPAHADSNPSPDPSPQR